MVPGQRIKLMWVPLEGPVDLAAAADVGGSCWLFAARLPKHKGAKHCRRQA